MPSDRPPGTAAVQAEAEKFHAETLTTAFLAARLRNAVGAATLCDRCKTNRGRAVLVGSLPGQREWLCGPCLGEPEQRPERLRF